MKTTFKVLAVLSAVILSCATASAQSEKPNATASVDSKFCTRILELRSKASQLVSQRLSNLNSKRLEGAKKLSDKREEIDQRLGDDRERWDKNREEQYAKLLEKADTEAKKQAIVIFQNAVEEAVAKRRAAINLAQNNFRDGINSILATRKEKIDQLTEGYKKAINDALLKAETDCKTGTKMTIRLDLLSALKTARQEFNTNKQGIDKLGEQVKKLIEDRKAAFEKAKADFKTALEKAKADLNGIKASPTQ